LKTQEKQPSTIRSFYSVRMTFDAKTFCFTTNEETTSGQSHIQKKIQELIQEDIKIGFALILPVEILQFIPNSSLAPLVCQEQSTINTSGEKVSKFRMTHDQSFLGPSGSSVNMQVDTSKLPPCRYGHCLRCIIHYIISLRHHYPKTKIFICKFDYDAAYR